MSLNLRKPRYRCEPITSLSSLSAALRLEEPALRDLADQANGLYRAVKPEPGSNRETFDAKGLLKVVHRRIKEQILTRVDFPDYLNGSIKGRDYVTNAKLHAGKQILICEDVKKFFPSVSSESVHDIWSGFFKFSPEVSRLLTALTTKDGALPQGAITSSYLANLILWRYEPLLEAKLAAQGITYSRYVDDIAMSSRHHITKDEQRSLIAQVYGMLRKVGLKAGRSKHEIYSATSRMIATKLMVNKKPSMIQERRSAVRAAVFQLEQAIARGEITPETVRLADKAAQRVGQLGRFHPTQADDLRERVRDARKAMMQSGLPVVVTQGKTSQTASENRDSTVTQLPWE